MTGTKVDLITGLTFELTADGTAVQESTDSNSVVKEFSDDVEQIAQQVFEAMRFSAGSLQRVNEPQPPEWVPKGNSFMQDHARDVARAILARCGHQPAPLEANGPAMPEDGEPASVTGEPSDENCWRWYAYCPEEGIEMHSDKKQAQSAAQSIMASYEVAVHSDGWHEDMESVSWGMLVPVEQAQVVERKTAEFYDEFSEWVKYELRPVRYSHQPAPPAEGEVGELVALIRQIAMAWEPDVCLLGNMTAKQLARAAALLEQRHPTPVPAATETRYEFCVYDENYIDQAGGTAPTYAQALSEGRHYLAQYQQDGPHTLELRRIERLPLPAAEVTP